MKTAKPPSTAPEALPTRRSQPVRQTRTNPPRTSTTANRNPGRDSGSGNARHEQPIDIFPGVTHFADTITALPKELVKHFTLLKEVDAKIHIPQQALFQLIDNALRLPTPNATRSPYDGTPITQVAPISASATTHNSNGSTDSHAQQAHTIPAIPFLANQSHLQNGDDALAEPAFDRSNLPRRQLFRQVALEIKEMLVALEEKNHVISTANDALNKQLARIDDIWPHLEQEFSEEAKWGSATHWAYPENRAAHRANNNAQAERSRREGAANLSAAAQQIAEEAAARSDARKQAVAARRSQKNNQHQDSDADSHNQKGEAKKAGGSKSRKPLPDPNSAAGIGVGIAGATAAPGTNGTAISSSRRRKVEKPASAQPMERALSGVFGAGGSNTKTRNSSPRESPVPDGGAKKRKALPSGGNQAKKTRNGISVTSSPVIGAFPDLKPLRGSPALPNSALGSPMPEITGRFDDIGSTTNSGVVSISTIENLGNTTSEPVSSSAVTNNQKVIGSARTSTIIPHPSSCGSLKSADIVETGQKYGAGDNGTTVGSNKTAGIASNSVVADKKDANVDGAIEKPASQIVSNTLVPGQISIRPQPDVENGRQRPAPLALSVETQLSSNGSNSISVKEAQFVPVVRSVADKAAVPGKDITAPVLTSVGAPARSETLKTDAADSPQGISTPPTKAEDPVAKKEPVPSSTMSVLAAQPQPVTTKSGRASKPSTPALATFAEASRSRPSRTTETGGTGGNNSSTSSTSSNGAVKRSHKKGASISSHAHAQAALVASNSGILEAANGHGNGYNSSGSGNGTRQQQQQQQQRLHQDEDEGDPLYCYCQQISFGEMIACDADDCAREWFHLECVGLRVAPKANVKWYCDDCKKRLKVGDRKANGR